MNDIDSALRDAVRERSEDHEQSDFGALADRAIAGGQRRVRRRSLSVALVAVLAAGGLAAGFGLVRSEPKPVTATAVRPPVPTVPTSRIR